MHDLNLYMVLSGCRPPGRFTEQHDVFFGIGHSLKELVPALKASWPEAKSSLHIDAWRTVTSVEGYTINIIVKNINTVVPQSPGKLFFINLGGYKKGEFEEFHYRMLVVAENSGLAAKKAKQELFYQQVGFKGAAAHIDDKYGVDVDEIYQLEDILSEHFKEKYSIVITESEKEPDQIHLGYLQLWKIKNSN